MYHWAAADEGLRVAAVRNWKRAIQIAERTSDLEGLNRRLKQEVLEREQALRAKGAYYHIHHPFHQASCAPGAAASSTSM